MLEATAAAIGADVDLEATVGNDFGSWKVELGLPSGEIYIVWLDRSGRFLCAYGAPGQCWYRPLPSLGKPPYTKSDARRDFLDHLWQTHAGMPLPASLGA